MLLINAGSDNGRVNTAPAVLAFQKICVFLCGQTFFKLLIDTHFSFRNAASTSQNFVYNLLRKSKGRGFSFLCLTVKY